MKTSEHIKNSLEACGDQDLDRAMLFVCLAIDGTAKRMYPDIESVGGRFRKFIQDHIDIIELMFGGLDLRETIFPIKDSRGNVGIKFEDVVYEKFRCNLAHGDELPSGFGLSVKLAAGVQKFMIDVENQSMTLPESAIYGLGLACVLSPMNKDQKIGSNIYYYRDPINIYVVDRWWGKIDCARQIMDFESQPRMKMNFS